MGTFDSINPFTLGDVLLTDEGRSYIEDLKERERIAAQGLQPHRRLTLA